MSARDSLHSNPDEEVTLVEIWDILVRRRREVCACLLVCLLAAGVYLFVKTPVYETTAKLRIGQVANLKEPASAPLEDPDVLAAWLLGRYGEEIATGIKRPLPFLKRADVQKGSQQILELAVRGRTPEESAGFLRKLSDESIERHRKIFDTTIETARARMAQIDVQRRQLRGVLLHSDDLGDALKRKDAVQASLVILERGRIVTELSELERELPLWQEKLNSPRTVMTQMFGEAASPAEPVAPKTLLVVAVAFALGIGGGVVLAFVVEFAAKAKSARLPRPL